MIGGVGVGLSASYKWQAVFNSLGRWQLQRLFWDFREQSFPYSEQYSGFVYGQLFEKISSNVLDRSQLPLPAQKHKSKHFSQENKYRRYEFFPVNNKEYRFSQILRWSVLFCILIFLLIFFHYIANQTTD